MVLIKYSNLTTTAMKQFLTAIALALLLPLTGLSAAEPSFRALVLTERGGHTRASPQPHSNGSTAFRRKTISLTRKSTARATSTAHSSPASKCSYSSTTRRTTGPTRPKRPLNRLSSTERLDGWDFTTLRFWATSTASPCGNGSRTSWVAYASKTT